MARGFAQTCPCSLFDGYECRSTKSRDACKEKIEKFYNCADVNSIDFYADALAHFKAIEKELTSPKGGSAEARQDFRCMFQRKPCDGNLLKHENKTHEYKPNWDEDFVCRCCYLCYTENCARTDCERWFSPPESDYQIIDYQLPPLKGSCGKVDLVVRGDDAIYLTEVKPPQGNKETLLRMICEILTHASTLIDNPALHAFLKEKHRFAATKENVRPAIMFFSGTAQQKEYENCREEVKDILDRYGIKVLQCDKATKQIVARN